MLAKNLNTNLPFLADRKSDKSGGVASQVVAATRLASGGPGIFFLWTG